MRRQVFIGEQDISQDLLLDRCSRETLHIVVKDGQRVTGSAGVQFLPEKQAKLERMAILEHCRRKGIGKEMLLFFNTVLKVK